MKTKVVNPGDFREVGTIQQRNEQRNAYGEVEGNWQTFLADRRAFIEPLSAREVFNAQQVQSFVSHRITLWHEEGITAKMRFVSAGAPQRVFNFVGPIRHESSNNQIEVMAMEQT